MLFLFRSAPEVEKRIHSKLFRKFWRSRGTKEPAYITVIQATGQEDWDWNDKSHSQMLGKVEYGLPAKI